jgi:hypothetical protein
MLLPVELVIYPVPAPSTDNNTNLTATLQLIWGDETTIPLESLTLGFIDPLTPVNT